MTSADRSATFPPKSYRARQGRLSARTVHAIEDWWPRYGLGPPPAAGRTPRAGEAPTVDPRSLLPECGAVVLEIGCGMGESTVAMAVNAPAIGIIAAEVHTRGVARLLAAAGAHGLTNLRVVAGDGRAVLDRIPTGTLAGVRCYFPDPWPKARQRKRRLVGPDMLARCADALGPGGSVHLATDDPDYAVAMLDALVDEPRLGGAAATGGFRIPRPQWRPRTRYEAAGLAEGRPAIDLLARRVATALAPSAEP